MSMWRTRSLVEGMWRCRRRRNNHRPRGRRGWRFHRPHHQSPNNPPPFRLGKNRQSARQDGPSRVRSADDAAVTLASNPGPCLSAGFVIINTSVRRTPLSITRHVCAALREYFTIVPNRTAVNRVRTILADVVRREEQRDGVVLRYCLASYLAYCFIGHCSAVKNRLKPATRGIRGRAAVAGLLLIPPKRDSWTAARTFKNIVR